VPDVADVADGDALVDDVGGEVGQVEAEDRLDDDQRQDDRDVHPVGAKAHQHHADQGHEPDLRARPSAAVIL
jgi:hypothetical protein